MLKRSLQLSFIPVLILSVNLSLFMSCDDEPISDESETSQVKLGAEVFIENHLQDFEELRIGLVMNPTARIGNIHMLDTLLALDMNVSALFAPEHGFRGEAGAGEKIEDGYDQATGLPVFSLYGDTRKPTQEMLEEVDMLIFDMQDVGARFYTYIATLGLVIEAAADADIPIWILDRPNPAGGNYVNGWILEEEFSSFVGAYPIPVAHGLTMGEIAQMMVGERWIEFETEPEVQVVTMQNWDRDMKWPDTGLDWIPPSPNLPTFEHAYLYLGTVFYEGTTLSEGRGTPDPFLTIGDPDTRLDSDQMEQLQTISPSLQIERSTFTPISIPGVAPSPKHMDVESHGIKISALDYNFDPFIVGLKIFEIMFNATEGADQYRFLYLLTGTREIDALINGEIEVDNLRFDLDDFMEKRSPYLLY